MVRGVGLGEARGAVGEAEGGEFRIAHPEGLGFGGGGVVAGAQARDPLVAVVAIVTAAVGRLAGGLGADGGGDEGEDFVLVEPLQPHVLVDVPGAGFEVVLGEVAGAADGAEAEGRGGQTLREAVFGEGVEEGGGGAVGGLAVIAEDRGDGAEHEEEVEVGEEVVQVPGAGDFGGDHFGVFFVGGLFEKDVLERV